MEATYLCVDGQRRTMAEILAPLPPMTTREKWRVVRADPTFWALAVACVALPVAYLAAWPF